MLDLAEAQKDPFEISEMTKYDFSKNIVFIEFKNLLDKDQYITNITFYFADSSKTITIDMSNPSVYQSYQEDVYEYVNESHGEYGDYKHSCIVMANQSETYSNKYYDAEGKELECDYVVDKSCLKEKLDVVGQIMRYDYLAVPSTKERTLDGEVIKQKIDGNILIPKDGSAKVKIEMPHLAFYGINVDEWENKYNISACSNEGCVVLDPEWWAGSWSYRTCFNITSPNSIPNVSVNLTMDTSTLIGDSKLQPDCGDFRVVNSSDNSTIEWGIDICNSSDSNISFKMNMILGNNSVCLYYGNDDADNGNISWFDAYYMLHDDFNDESLNTSLWGIYTDICNCLEADDIVKCFQGCSSWSGSTLYSLVSFSGYGLRAKLDFYLSSGGPDEHYRDFIISPEQGYTWKTYPNTWNGLIEWHDRKHQSVPNTLAMGGNSSERTEFKKTSPTYDIWITEEFRMNTTHTEWWFNNTLYSVNLTNWNWTSSPLYFVFSSWGNGYWDEISDNAFAWQYPLTELKYYKFSEETHDITAPLWQNQGQNETLILSGESIELYAQGYDNIALDWAWLETNETGEWENKTAYYSIDMEDTSATWEWSNFTWQNSSIENMTVGWRIYYNDTSGNENKTDILTFNVTLVNITFNITSGEDGSQLTNINIYCNNSWNATGVNSPYSTSFLPGSYSCTFELLGYYNKTLVFEADSDKIIDIIMEEKFSLTIQEHDWLSAIYECVVNGDCTLYNLLIDINETTSKTWNQFKRTDQSIVTFENVTSSIVSNTSNLTIDYTVNIPIKEGYGVVEGLQGYDDFLPIRISYWFLNESNTTCYNQGEKPNGVESTYCNPLTVQTVGQINTSINFTVDLRPDLPEGDYTIVRNIEIDPDNVWVDYGQEIIGKVKVLTSGESLISLRYAEENAKEVLRAVEESTSKAITDAESSITGLASLLASSNISLMISVITFCLVAYLIVTRKR